MTGVIFPLYSSHKDAEVEGHLAAVYTCLQAKDRLYAIEDGGDVFRPLLEKFTGDPRVIYRSLTGRAGLTRSWNIGGIIACRDGCDVVIFGNQDAHPHTAEDFDSLVEDTITHPEFFALGPVTNNEGHGPTEQRVTNPHRPSEVRRVSHINGFTWAIERNHYKRVVDARGQFLDGSPVMRFDWPSKQNIELNGHGEKQSLAYVGQEDEVFTFAFREFALPVAVSGRSFWVHDKWSLHRATKHA